MNAIFRTLTGVVFVSGLMAAGACKESAPKAPAKAKKSLTDAKLKKALSVTPTLKKVTPAPNDSKNPFNGIEGLPGSDPKRSREQRAQMVRKTYAEKGTFPAVKEYRTIMNSTLAEAAFFVDLEKELKGDPSMEAVRKAVMSEKNEIALSEAMRITKDKAKAQKIVDDLKVVLIPVTLDHAKGIRKRSGRAAFSMAHRLFPNTPVWELEAKLK